MWALRASRLVCSAMSWIRLTTLPIFCAEEARPSTCTLVVRAVSLAWPAMMLELDSRRPISSIEADSSSAAAATVWTPAEACSEAAAAAFDRCAVSRSEEHTSELQSLMRISYAVFCLKKKKKNTQLTDKEHGHKT